MTCNFFVLFDYAVVCGKNVIENFRSRFLGKLMALMFSC